MLVPFSSNQFLERKYIYFNCKKNFFEWINTDRVDIFSWITSTTAPQKLELNLSKTLYSAAIDDWCNKQKKKSFNSKRIFKKAE